MMMFHSLPRLLQGDCTEDSGSLDSTLNNSVFLSWFQSFWWDMKITPIIWNQQSVLYAVFCRWTSEKVSQSYPSSKLQRYSLCWRVTWRVTDCLVQNLVGTLTYIYNCLYNIKIVIIYNVYINNSQIVGTRSKGQSVIPFPLIPNNTFGTLD
jgi:hypothetical protein